MRWEGTIGMKTMILARIANQGRVKKNQDWVVNSLGSVDVV